MRLSWNQIVGNSKLKTPWSIFCHWENSSECLPATSNYDIYEILMPCQYLFRPLRLVMYKTQDFPGRPAWCKQAAWGRFVCTGGKKCENQLSNLSVACENRIGHIQVGGDFNFLVEKPFHPFMQCTCTVRFLCHQNVFTPWAHFQDKKRDKTNVASEFKKTKVGQSLCEANESITKTTLDLSHGSFLTQVCFTENTWKAFVFKTSNFVGI